MASNYFVKLEHFEGPLDLLLHLIRVHELDIFQIDLLTITSQYLSYLRLMNFKDLKDAAAFMEMAATLIEMKSRQLLPQEAAGQAVDLDDEEEEDPAQALQQRLVMYDTFRQAALYLQHQSCAGSLVCGSGVQQDLMATFSECVAPLRGDPHTLLVLYEQMLAALAEKRPVTVQAVTESLTVDEVIAEMAKTIEQLGFVLFQKLLVGMSSRYELIAHVLAMLQLVRDRRLKLYQEEHWGPIWLYGNRVQPGAWEQAASATPAPTTTRTPDAEVLSP